MWHSCSLSRSFGAGEAWLLFGRLPFGHATLDYMADADVRREEVEEYSGLLGRRRAFRSFHAMNAADRLRYREVVPGEEVS